jgi:cobalamin biosynthesis Mg chelatase CobN
MKGMPLHPRPLGARSLVLSSVLALVALMCFPLLAQANDSSGVVYETRLPNAGGHHSEHEPIAKSSTHSGGTSSAEPSQESSAPSEVSSNGSSSEEGEGGGSTNTPQRHQGSPANAKGNPGKNAAKSPAQASPAPSPADEGGGGSSPLVPILIAIAALAAVSIGVVLVRQRRQRPSGPGDLSTRTG